MRYLLLLLLLPFTLHAQLYPVQVTVQAMSPYPVYLSDFTQGSSDRVRVQLLLTDVHASRRVRLKLSLQSNSLSLANPDIVSGALPIELSGGLPVYLGNDDLRPYFSPGNLPGLSAGAYAQPLPEGVYTLCIEAFDYITNQPLSRKSCYTMALIQNDPPQLSLPRNNEAVQQQTPQSLLFQWTPRHINATNVSYEFSLLELLDTFISPQAAMQVMQPYYQTTTYATSLWLGPGDAPLTPGRKYAWRVRAKSLSGIDELGVFKNNGYSETWSFRYTDGQCTAPQGLLVTGTSRRSLQLQWPPLPPALDGTEVSYSVSYRAVNSSQWYGRQTTTTALTLTDLDPGTNYELRIGRLCSGTGYVYSNSITSATAAATDTNTTVRCGIAPATVDLGNITPLAAMQTGETFIAGDFTVTTTAVSGSSGTFSGEGYIKIPYLGFAKVRVKFNDIFINQDRQMAKGYIETLYDPSWKGILDADKITEGGIGTGQVKTGLAATEYHTDFPIDDPTAIKVRVTGPDHTAGISITDVRNGGGSGLEIPAAQLPATVSDSKGDIYTVEPGSNGSTVVTKTGWQVPLEQAAVELDQLSADKGVVQFSAGSNTRYAFDAYRGIYGSSVVWSKCYQSLGGQYRVAAKATLAGKPDHITAEVRLSDPGMKADSVWFVTGKGLRYAATHTSGNNYDITLTGSAADDAQELYALYPAGTPGNYQSLGKLLVAGYAGATAKVVVVPVNGATTDTADIRRQLSASYGGIGVSWSVQQAAPWANSSWDADHNGKLSVTGSSGWSVYTDEMKSLNAAYRSAHQIVADAAYLFVLPQAAEEGVAGDMPRGKRYGYLFNGSDGRTAAHELGHGLFALKHTFDNAYGFATTDLGDNVMSYGTGTGLSKLQWDAVHAPGLVIGAFEDDEDAMAAKRDLVVVMRYKDKGVLKEDRKETKDMDLESYLQYKDGLWQSFNLCAAKGDLTEWLEGYGAYTLGNDCSYSKKNDFRGLHTGYLLITMTDTPPVYKIRYFPDRIQFEANSNNKNVLVFANGYRFKGASEYPNSDNSIREYINDESGNIGDYWGEIDNLFLARLKDRKVLYADGHHSIATSNHINMVNFARSMIGSACAAGDVKLQGVALALSPWLAISCATCYHDNSCVTLDTQPNYSGFNQRKANGRIAGLQLIAKLQQLSFDKATEKVDIVAHSMGFAYAQGIIEQLKQNNYKLGRYYILAPENGPGGSVNPGDFEDICQYGANELELANKKWLLDGVAPQAPVNGIGILRAFIPIDGSIPMGFVESHSIGNYKWIFNQKKSGQIGYVQPR